MVWFWGLKRLSTWKCSRVRGQESALWKYGLLILICWVPIDVPQDWAEYHSIGSTVKTTFLYVYDFDYGDGFMGVWICPNSPRCIHKCVQLKKVNIRSYCPETGSYLRASLWSRDFLLHLLSVHLCWSKILTRVGDSSFRSVAKPWSSSANVVHVHSAFKSFSIPS